MRAKLHVLKVFKTILCVVLWLIVFLMILLFFKPIKTDSLALVSNPSITYEESLSRIKALESQDSGNVDTAGRAILMSHGKKVERVIVFFHGFTNSPRQFEALGKEFYKLGFNVFIPRVSYHGLRQASSSELSKLTAEDLVSVSNQAVDIAQGLGKHVSVVGLSMGGVMAGWVAQVRGDVNLAVLIAPNFGTYKVPGFLLKSSINFLILKRDTFIWWDFQKKNFLPRPQTAYVGFSSRALGEIRRLGYYVQVLAEHLGPQAQSILVVTNANDYAVSRKGIDAVIHRWQKNDVKRIKVFEFEKSLKLGHDIIDPEQPFANVAVVYPKLITLITQQESVD